MIWAKGQATLMRVGRFRGIARWVSAVATIAILSGCAEDRPASHSTRLRSSLIRSVTSAESQVGASKSTNSKPRVERPAFEGIWPETNVTAARLACRRVQRGAEGWRSDPYLLAPVFSRRVLGWTHPVVVRGRQNFYLSVNLQTAMREEFPCT